MTVVPDLPTRVSDDRLEPAAAAYDRVLVGTVLLLIVLGLTAVTSASAPKATSTYGNAYAILLRQVVGLGIGGVGALVVLMVPWHRLRQVARPMYGGILVLMLLTATPLGHMANGAQRWLPLGVINLQATEFAKPVLALFLADHLSQYIGRIRQPAVVVAVLVATAPLILATVVGAQLMSATGIPLVGQSDLGAAFLLAGMVFMALWVAGLEPQWVAFFIILGATGLLLAILAAPYRLERIIAFVWGGDAQTTDFQVIQGWVAMAMGGWTGVGVGRGIGQGDGYLPEAHTDMISAVVAEEMGVIGWSVLVGAQMMLLVRGLRVASRATMLYDVVVATTLTTVLGMQAAINLLVVVGWFPPKGLVLPFVSYGASAAVADMVMVGMLLRIGTHTEPEG